MADNVDIAAGIWTGTVAADVISSVAYQRCKLVWGADGTANDASAATPLPVALTTGEITTGAASLTKAVNAASADGDAGVAVLAKRVDTPTTIGPAAGDYTWLQVDALGRLHIYAAGVVGAQPQSSGGWQRYRLVSAASTNEAVIKASAGQFGGGLIINTNATARYVKLHNVASAPIAGTTAVALTIKVEGSSQLSLAEILGGLEFDTGLGITTVTEATDGGTTAVGAGDLIIQLWYK